MTIKTANYMETEDGVLFEAIYDVDEDSYRFCVDGREIYLTHTEAKELIEYLRAEFSITA